MKGQQQSEREFNLVELVSLYLQMRCSFCSKQENNDTQLVVSSLSSDPVKKCQPLMLTADVKVTANKYELILDLLEA